MKRRRRGSVAGRACGRAAGTACAAPSRISSAAASVPAKDSSPLPSHSDRHEQPALVNAATRTADAAIPVPTPAKWSADSSGRRASVRCSRTTAVATTRTMALAAPPRKRRTRKGSRDLCQAHTAGRDRTDGKATDQPAVAGHWQIWPGCQQGTEQVAEKVGGSDQARGGSAETQCRDHCRQDGRIDEAADAERGGQGDQAAKRAGPGLGRGWSDAYGWFCLHERAHMSCMQFQEAI